MKIILQLEELGKLILCYLGSLWMGYSWWLFFALLLLPDLSMVGYAFNNRLGAFLYNLFHHQAVAVGVAVAGYYGQQSWLILAGLVLFGHSSMDRMFGYGLKYADGFNHTHLGVIGKKHPSSSTS